ncbi:MAG TPA: hypothetical protein VF178_09090, partial [Gemmatimonadaceae bacterium]
AQAPLPSAIASWNTATEMARERAPARPSRPVRAPEARAEIDDAIAAFGAALESRDLSRLRRAYPGMTVAQAQEWGAFFLKARNLTVRLNVTAMDRAGLRVNATVDGTYDYDDINTGQGMHQAVSLQATLERGSSGWRLMSIH